MPAHAHRHRKEVTRTRPPFRAGALGVVLVAISLVGSLATDQWHPAVSSDSRTSNGGVATLPKPPTPPVLKVPPPKAPSGTTPTQGSKRPNIVMVMADDMRVDDLVFAPNISRLLADQGMTFRNSFSPFPLCCPARASFLSGRYAHNHGVYWHKDPYGYAAFDDSRTLATSLSEAGYNTGFIGKYLNGYGPDTSLVSGQPSYTHVPDGWTDWVGAFEKPGVKGIHGGTYNYFDTPYNVNGELDNSHRGTYQTSVVGDFSVDMARNYHRANAPFFMYVSYIAPHHGGPQEEGDPTTLNHPDGTFDGFQTPARPDWVKGKFDDLITRPSGMPVGGGPAEADVSDKPGFFAALDEMGPGEYRALTNLTRQRAESIYVMDRQVGRLAKELKRTGEWANTVFMFTSDNGYFLGEHRQRTGKVRAHEPVLRVPFLLTGPGMRSGQERFDPVTTVDVSATILDLADAEPPHTPDGRSLVKVLLGGDQGWVTPVVTEAIHSITGPTAAEGFEDEPRSSVGLRTLRYSFTRYKTGAGELYDLWVDPAQMNNRFTDPGYANVTKELTRLWFEYKDCVGQECQVPLPASLQGSVRDGEVWTQRFWNRMDALYGHRSTSSPR
jgi:N-acetylglucosamine-6-sulfatase